MTKEHRRIQVETTVEILIKSEKNTRLDIFGAKIDKILNRARKNDLSPALIFFSGV